MKAKEWVAKYEADKQDEFFKAYAEETAQLIASRTQGSGVYQHGEKKVDTKPAAIEGAVREQRRKWQSICNNVGSLTEGMFEIDVLGFHLPAVAKMEKDKKQPVVEQEIRAKPEEITAGQIGRTLVT